MAVETLGEAYQLGWRIKVFCARGKRHGMKTIRECIDSAALDMKTLVWTRGEACPLEGLELRLKCPSCGSRRVRLVFDRTQSENQKNAKR